MRSGENAGMPPTPTEHDLRRPLRLQRAVFQSIGDDSRPALVERRLTEAIMSGLLRAGERLPSETHLAASFGVSATTVREALNSLRMRGLVVTVRGRHGGSYVDESADPLAFAHEALDGTTLVELRDMGVFHAVIAAGAVRLAARRAAPDEIERIRLRLDALDEQDLGTWRRGFDDLFTELTALGQSPRLTRELMQRQLEFSPYLRLLDDDAQARAEQRTDLLAVIDAIDSGDESAAAAHCEQYVRRIVGRLVRLKLAGSQPHG